MSSIATTSPDSDDTSAHSPISDSESSAPGLQVPEYSSVLDQNDGELGPWGNVLQRVIKAIVTIKVNILRSFDTDPAGWKEGTGFVVDRANGIILSNRHLVTQAPITATAIF